VLVHNGIVTNSAALRAVLIKRGYTFQTETDTESVAILTKYVWDSQPDKRITFTELVKTVLKEVEGSFALVIKSTHFPNEVVTARRGSPLLIGVKTTKSSRSTLSMLNLLVRITTSSWMPFHQAPPLRCLHPQPLIPRSFVLNPAHSCQRTAFPNPSNSSSRRTLPP
jgi:glucosamine--fructose-6-phosphate aminotransferase (isomerizing)